MLTPFGQAVAELLKSWLDRWEATEGSEGNLIIKTFGQSLPQSAINEIERKYELLPAFQPRPKLIIRD